MHRAQEPVVPKDASGLTVGIVVSDFNTDITHALLVGAQETCKEWGVTKVQVVHVPGSFEIPFAVQKLLSREPKVHAVIALGCIIKGETDHDRYLATAVTDALVRLSLDHHVPVSSGVLTVNTLDQAIARTKGEMNRGREAAVAALTSALI